MSEFTLDRQQYHAMLAFFDAKSRVGHFACLSLQLHYEVDGDEHAREADAALQEWRGIERACATELTRLGELRHHTT